MKIKTLTVKELRTKKPEEVTKYITELQTTMTELIMAISTNKEKQTHQIGLIKKSIAKANTISSERLNTEKEN